MRGELYKREKCYTSHQVNLVFAIEYEQTSDSTATVPERVLKQLARATILGDVVDQPFPLQDDGIDISGFPTLC